MRRWNSDPFDMWREMAVLQDEMQRLFGRYGASPRGGRQASQSDYPPLQLWQDEEHLYVESELPGLALDDLEIVVTRENQLSIKGERKQPDVGEGRWHRQECGYGSFARIVQLPHEVAEAKVCAELTNGVLTITLPKRAEAKPRRIQVKAG